jgi:hypothetical protein
VVTTHAEVGVADLATGRRRRLTAPVLVAGLTAAATMYVFAIDPNSPGHYPVCPSYALAGIYCPGCGMLRATHDLAHGDVAGALQRNPLAPLFLLGLAGLWVAWVWSRWTGRRIVWQPAAATPWVIGAVVVAYTVARNIPGWTWLSPA